VGGDPQNDDYDEKYIIDDAFRVILHNDTNAVDTTVSGWISGDSPLEIINITQGNFWFKRDYEIRILGANADTSRNNIPVNFQVWDVTNPDSMFKHDFIFFDYSEPNVLDHNDIVNVFNNHMPPKIPLKLTFQFPADLDSSYWVPPQKGDIYAIKTRKGFDRHDVFEFSFSGNDYSAIKAKKDLDNI